MECLPSRSSRQKLLGINRFTSVGANGVTVSLSRLSRVKAGADDGIRTRDLRFTKPLLYQLSYVGKRGQTLHRGNSVAIALNGLAPSLARARDRDC